jgi:hypothetical protein
MSARSGRIAGSDFEREPHYGLEYYHRFEPNDIHYDDIAKYLSEQMAQHNRVVLILQGILDRSPVFHPHPPWQLYTQAGFEQGCGSSSTRPRTRCRRAARLRGVPEHAERLAEERERRHGRPASCVDAP